MAVKKLKPTTPGQRGMVTNAYVELTTSAPEKSLCIAKSKSGGRNSKGRMTMRYRGGGARKILRTVDFKRDKHGIEGTVKTVEYDPNRSAFLSLIFYADGEKRYILAPNGIKVGSKIVSGDKVAPEIGNAMQLQSIPLGTIIHNIELRPGQGAKMARSAGSYAQLAARDGRYAVIKLPSGETRMILTSCMATIGAVSNPDNSKVRSGKAGTSRLKGRRPRVRGVAMNPVDHPMGGGEGRSSGGQPRSRTGVMSKGFKTRKKNKASSRYIIEKRKKK